LKRESPVPRVLTDEDVTGFRERLIETAERLFAQRGEDGVSMRLLATEVGVSAMTPYRYFKDKDEILAAVRTRGFDNFAEALEKALASSPDPSVSSRRVGEAYVTFAVEHPAAYRLMFDLYQPTTYLHPELIRAALRARKTMKAHVVMLYESGLVEGDLERLAHIFWAGLHGLVVLRMSGMLAPEMDFRSLAREQYQALIRGFRPKPRHWVDDPAPPAEPAEPAPEGA
jgi:AcrR family transcriptional regulator